jgi:alkanesulfonate monooxygenase SsuD/methylene tetrahydromethanopterin reductase-like flavin-dependent oxidoreductase (luciferase family)
VTERLQPATAVTCPTVRIHPAIVAQAVATAATMMPGRFLLGVGTGENLNGRHYTENARLYTLPETPNTFSAVGAHQARRARR